MRLSCPACGVHGSLELFASDADAREVSALAARLPADLGPLALRYITLFRPPKRVLPMHRAHKLLRELVEMMDAGAVVRSGKRVEASPALFGRAIEQMLAKDALQRPLKDHNYLRAVVMGQAPRAAAAAEDAAEAAKRTHSAQRSGPTETDADRMARMRREQEEADRRETLRRQVAESLKRGSA